MEKEYLIKNFLIKRRNLFEIIFITAVIGVGINFISNSVYEYFFHNGEPLQPLFIGLILLLASAFYFTLRFFRKQHQTYKFEGFIVFNKKDFLPVFCDGYKYSESLKMNFDAAFVENKAMNHIWFSEKQSQNEKNNIIIEATEYYLIDLLSTHLKDYFYTKEIDQSLIETISRNDIPSILLKNRFLELFSKPMNQREAFLKKIEKNESEDSEIRGKILFMSLGRFGPLFKNFEFVLPTKSKVSKTDNVLFIDTPRFILSFQVNYQGFGTVLPRGFEKYYLGFESYDEFDVNEIEVKVQFDFKPSSYFSLKGWNYYEWADDFVEKADQYFSAETYFNKIKWSTVYTQIKALENSQNENFQNKN